MGTAVGRLYSFVSVVLRLQQSGVSVVWVGGGVVTAVWRLYSFVSVVSRLQQSGITVFYTMEINIAAL